MLPAGSLVAVTGATGFIGTALCHHLRDHGLPVRALVRNPARAASLAACGAELVEGDLADPDALQALTRDCDAVVHAAGAVRGGCQADFDRVNVTGTGAIVTAVKQRAPHARLLLLSSLAAREPALSWYARSKREGEALLAGEPDLDWLVLRPPAVYGPGDREMLPVFRAMSRGLATVPGNPGARTSLIHVNDLVAAITACLHAPAARHRILALDDGHPGGYDWHELADVAAAVWARRVRVWRVPGPLLDAVARCNLVAARLTGRAPMLTPAKLRELRHPDWVVDNEDIAAVTGWEPTIDLRRGLQALRDSAL